MYMVQFSTRSIYLFYLLLCFACHTLYVTCLIQSYDRARQVGLTGMVGDTCRSHRRKGNQIYLAPWRHHREVLYVHS